MSDDTPVVGYILVSVGLVAAMADTVERMARQLHIVEIYAARVAALADGTATPAQRAQWHGQALADIPASREEARGLGIAVEGMRQQLIVVAAPVGRVS